jgi:glutathione peroxidase
MYKGQMISFVSVLALTILGSLFVSRAGDKPPEEHKVSSIYEFVMKDIDGKEASLQQFKGKVLLIVNVASQCGYTPQYEGLEKIYSKYKEKDFVILGFPANNFMGQEPGTDEEIKSFCSLTYGVNFPLFSKISVKGKDQHPLYQFLTEKETNPQFSGEITWNFNKFLIDRNGKIIGRFGTRIKPEDKEIVQAIENAIK